MARKSGLGKGLDALIPSGVSPVNVERETNRVPVEKIIPNPQQPRHWMSEEGLQELADSIKENGILQPLLVSYETDVDQYILIAGERRFRAAQLAGLTVVPVVERHVTEQQRLELALIENIQRADLTPLETAEAYRNLNEEFGLTHEEIGKRVGKSRVAVTNTLRLLKLPEQVRRALAEEKITEGHARHLLSLKTAQAQLSALTTILKQDLTVRQTKVIVDKLNGEKPVREVPPKTVPPEVQAIEERLRGHLGTKVTLHHGKKGGSLVIHYYSDEELESLIARMTGG